LAPGGANFFQQAHRRNAPIGGVECAARKASIEEDQEQMKLCYKLPLVPRLMNEGVKRQTTYARACDGGERIEIADEDED
jgi:hypothetical protein